MCVYYCTYGFVIAAVNILPNKFILTTRDYIKKTLILTGVEI